MKKLIVAFIAVCIVATMGFIGVGCKTTAASETTAAAGAASETAAAGEAAETTAAPVAGGELKLALVPKVVHPWFDIVNIGAQEMANLLTENTNTKVTVEYIAPASADVAEQNMILQNAAAKQVDGIIIDPLDVDGSAQVFEEIQAQGILVTLFDLAAFDDWTSVTSTDVDIVNAEMTRLMDLIGGKGKVAVMQGFPTAPSHKQRYDLFKELVPKLYPNVELIEGGVDNDDMETARQQAAATIAANPDLVGYLVCDAAGPVGVGQAIKEAGKVGEIQCVGMGEMTSILDLVKEGVLESTVYLYPDMQGSYSVMLHYMNYLGVPIPKEVDMGVKYIDKTNVDEYLGRFATTG
jgi:ribose transport system substrate-binding protein